MNELIAKLRERRAAALDEMQALADALASDETRSAFNEEERTAFDALRAEVDEIDQRVKDFEAVAERRAAAETASRTLGADTDTTVSVGNEPRTYTAEAERFQGVSIFRDLVNAKTDPAAAERLARHQREAQAHELRDVGTGAFAGLTVPQYLTDMVAPIRRANRPLANLANTHPLPADGMTVNISRITTGTAVASQATENSAVQETNADDTLLTVPVVTIAGMQDVSRQAIERSTGVDSIIVQDLVSAYDAEIDRQLIHADGTSGTHLGILSTTGNVDVTYTDVSPTVAELYPKLADAVQQVQAAVYMGVSHFVMHPRRYWWMAKEVGTSFPFFQPSGLTAQTAGQVAGTEYGQVHIGPLGINVVLDGNIATNLGAGTNEDVILAVTASELHLWEQPGAPLMLRTDEALSNQLSVRFVVYGYSAFTAGRYPASQANITGTGLVTPTF